MAHRYALGYRWQEHDPRDWAYTPSPLLVANRPDVSDLAGSMGPLLDQGQAGTCGPNSFEEMVTYLQIALGLPRVGASRLFLYWVTRYLMGTVKEDSGVDNRTMLRAAATYGTCAERDYLYSDQLTQIVRPPPYAAWVAAHQNLINNYAAVPQNDASMQGTLAAGRPFLFGFDVFPGIMSDRAAQTGIVPNPGPGETPLGGHDVTVCGYNIGPDRPGLKPGNVWPAGTYRFRNHWFDGPNQPWGDVGYGYIDFAYARGPHAGDFWVLNAVNISRRGWSRPHKATAA